MSVSGLTPTYNVVIVNLGDTDGQLPAGRQYNQQMGFAQVAFRDANGAPINNVQLQISFGSQNADKITLDYNGKVRCAVPTPDGGVQTVDTWHVFWQNTPGVYAYITISQDSRLFENDTPNPLQSFTSSIGTTIVNTAFTATTVAQLVSAANANRQSVMIGNNGAAGSQPIYVGGSAVTAANGIPIPPGGFVVLDKNVAGVYVITAAATQDVRVLEENL